MRHSSTVTLEVLIDIYLECLTAINCSILENIVKIISNDFLGNLISRCIPTFISRTALASLITITPCSRIDFVARPQICYLNICKDEIYGPFHDTLRINEQTINELSG